MTKHLFLTGFMGAGKTTIGLALSAELGVPFVDLDQQIVIAAEKSIPLIFAEEGEAVFRRLESKVLQSLSKSEPSIVSTGGGIVGRPENLVFMQKHGTIVYLYAKWETLKQRIGHDSGRPLVNSDGDWTATKSLWVERQPLYEQANIIIRTDSLTISETVSEIRRHEQL